MLPTPPSSSWLPPSTTMKWTLTLPSGLCTKEKAWSGKKNSRFYFTSSQQYFVYDLGLFQANKENSGKVKNLYIRTTMRMIEHICFIFIPCNKVWPLMLELQILNYNSVLSLLTRQMYPDIPKIIVWKMAPNTENAPQNIYADHDFGPRCLSMTVKREFKIFLFFY